MHERIACFVSARAVLHRATKMDLSDWDVSGVVSSVEGPSFGGSSARKSSTMRNPSSHVGGSSTQAEAFDAAEHERSIVAAIAHIRRLRSDVSAWSLTAESADGAHAASDPAPTRQATVPGATDACQLRTGTALECELHTRARASRTSRERAGIALSEAILRSIFRSVRQIPPPPTPRLPCANCCLRKTRLPLCTLLTAAAHPFLPKARTAGSHTMSAAGCFLRSSWPFEQHSAGKYAPRRWS